MLNVEYIKKASTARVSLFNDIQRSEIPCVRLYVSLLLLNCSRASQCTHNVAINAIHFWDFSLFLSYVIIFGCFHILFSPSPFCILSFFLVECMYLVLLLLFVSKALESVARNRKKKRSRSKEFASCSVVVNGCWLLHRYCTSVYFGYCCQCNTLNLLCFDLACHKYTWESSCSHTFRNRVQKRQREREWIDEKVGALNGTIQMVYVKKTIRIRTCSYRQNTQTQKIDERKKTKPKHVSHGPHSLNIHSTHIWQTIFNESLLVLHDKN